MSALVPDTPATIYRVQTARDPVLVVEFEGGGLISYLREDGTLMHTLNTSEGFHRKLCQLGVELLGDDGAGKIGRCEHSVAHSE